MARRHRDDEEGSEGYFASVSDLMVGILFIFLLMLTVFALNFADEDKDALIRQLTAERDAAHADLKDARARLERQAIEIKRLGENIDRLKNDLEALSKREAERSVELGALADRVGRIEAEVSTESQRLQELRRRLLVQLQENLKTKGVETQIPADNWRLSTDRALAVRNLMVGPRASLTELRNPAGQPLLGLAGYADSRPLPEIAGTDPRNRRIEVRFLLSASREAELVTLRNNLTEVRQRLRQSPKIITSF